MKVYGRGRAARVGTCLLAIFFLASFVSADINVWGWIVEKSRYLFDYLIDFLAKALSGALKPFFDIIQDSLFSNPTIYPLREGPSLTTTGELMKDFMLVLVPIYVFSILVTGLYMIFMSTSPSGRAQAKMIFDKLLVSMILVSMSPAVYQLLLFTSYTITRSVVSVITGEITTSSSLGEAFYSAMASTPWQAKIAYIFVWCWVLYSIIWALLVIWFRYICVKVLAFVFPFTLFLYLFDWTKHMGTKLLKFTLVWIYAPVIMAVWLAIGVSVVQATSSQEGFISTAGTPIFFIACMVMVGAAPLIMSGVMRWLGGIVSTVAMVIPGPYSIPLAGLGGIMQGKGVGAITSTGLKAGVSKMWGSPNKLYGRARGGRGGSVAGSGGPVGQGMRGDFGKGKESFKDLDKVGMGGKAAEKAGGAAGRAAGEAVKKGAKKAGGAAGKAAGEAGGKGIGAAIGSAVGSVVPGAGTAAGAKVGEKIGGQVGGQVGKQVGESAGAAVGEAAKKGMESAGKAAGKGGAAGARRAAGKLAGGAATAARGAAGSVARHALKPWGAASIMRDGLKAGYGAGKAGFESFAGSRAGQKIGGYMGGSWAGKAAGRTASLGGSIGRSIGQTASGAYRAAGRSSLMQSRGGQWAKDRLSPSGGGGAKASGGKTSGEKPQKAETPKDPVQQERDRMHLKEQLSSPDRRPQDPLRGTEQIMDGLDTD